MARAWNIIFRAGSFACRLLFAGRMLSIDIVLGVLCCFLFACRILESNVPSVVPVILCLVVWQVYTLDHLADARWLGEKSLKPVYRWHFRNRRMLGGCVIFLASTSLALSLVFLDPGVIFVGVICGVILLGYILIHSLPVFRDRYQFKEFWIALLYTSGIWLFPILYGTSDSGISLLLLIPAFFSLVLVNVLGYSLFEISADRTRGLKTFAVTFGKNTTRFLIFLFLIISVSFTLASILLSGEGYAAGVILLIMAVLLGLIQKFPGYFSRNDRFGILADLVFILPVCILLFQ